MRKATTAQYTLMTNRCAVSGPDQFSEVTVRFYVYAVNKNRILLYIVYYNFNNMLVGARFCLYTNKYKISLPLYIQYSRVVKKRVSFPKFVSNVFFVSNEKYNSFFQ